MKLTMLGTGHAVVTKCFNTCFILDDEGKLFLTDTGGGNMLLTRLEEAGYSWRDIHEIFISHKHTDHLLGVFWLIRMYMSALGRGGLKAPVNIYAHEEVISIIRQTALMLFGEKLASCWDNGLNLVTVRDGEERTINGRRFTFFDIHANKDRQFGYCMDMGSGEKFTFCGDEPLKECCFDYGRESRWLLHEAFCITSPPGIPDLKTIGHSAVRDACRLAEDLQAKNLILYHTEDQDLADRKKLYTEEGRQYYSGNLLVPDDLETVMLD